VYLPVSGNLRRQSISRAQRMGDVCTANGLPQPFAANNGREDGLTLMYELLNQRHEGVHLGNRIRTLSGWSITNHRTYPIPEDGENPTPIECLSQAIYDPSRTATLRSRRCGSPDVNDSLRYGIASRLLIAGAREKPLDVRRAKALRPFLLNPCTTSRCLKPSDGRLPLRR
jgi:hypothetical protein